MRSPSKRSRSKSNRPKPLGNIVNRVFESSGPEGKVRGTPQQIIDKYLTLARDAQLSGDRVASEDFLQHAEHYTRMLNDAQREMAREAEARREQQQQQHQNGQQGGGRRNDGQHGGQNDAQGDGQQGHDGSQDAGREGAPEAAQDGRQGQNHNQGQQNQGQGGERRQGGRNRRRDHDRADAAPAPDAQADAAGPSGLGDDGEAALVDTPESRAARHRAPAAETAVETQHETAAETPPENQSEARPEAQPLNAESTDAAGEGETAAAGNRRKPATRKPRTGTGTGTRRSPRSSASRSTDEGATGAGALADGTSNAAE